MEISASINKKKRLLREMQKMEQKNKLKQTKQEDKENNPMKGLKKSFLGFFKQKSEISESEELIKAHKSSAFSQLLFN